MAWVGGLRCQCHLVCRIRISNLTSNSISGIDWVSTAAASTGRPSVASMSIEGGAFNPVDQAVTNVISFFSRARDLLTPEIVGKFRCSNCRRGSVFTSSDLCVQILKEVKKLGTLPMTSNTSLLLAFPLQSLSGPWISMTEWQFPQTTARLLISSLPVSNFSTTTSRELWD